MSSRRPGGRPSDAEVLSDDCNTCDLLGASAKSVFSSQLPDRRSRPPPAAAAPRPIEPVVTTTETQEEGLWEAQKPPGIVEIGNAGWTTIHSFAAYYPDAPTETQRSSAKNLIDAFAELFPCRWCADDLKEHVKKNPVRTESRRAFSQWTCETHNHVNEHLGKSLFDCTKFDEIWRRTEATKTSSSSPL